MKPCVNCGQTNPEDHNFCLKCGRAFQPTTVSSKPEQPLADADYNRTAASQTNVAEEPRAYSTLQQRTKAFDKATLTPQQKLYFQQEYDKNVRNPSTALVLALLLGGAGAHRFYLGEWIWGIAYILFAWTFIPLLVALFECFVIRKRTEQYNENCANEILRKMEIIFSESGSPSALQFAR